jgi:hypothetical protein
MSRAKNPLTINGQQVWKWLFPTWRKYAERISYDFNMGKRSCFCFGRCRIRLLPCTQKQAPIGGTTNFHLVHHAWKELRRRFFGAAFCFAVRQGFTPRSGLPSKRVSISLAPTQLLAGGCRGMAERAPAPGGWGVVWGLIVKEPMLSYADTPRRLKIGNKGVATTLGSRNARGVKPLWTTQIKMIMSLKESDHDRHVALYSRNSRGRIHHIQVCARQ